MCWLSLVNLDHYVNIFIAQVLYRFEMKNTVLKFWIVMWSLWIIMWNFAQVWNFGSLCDHYEMKNTLFGTGFLNRLIYWYWTWMPSFFIIKKIVFFFNISNRSNRLNRTTKNCTARGQKTDPRQCALVPIMKIPISIGLVINLEKNRPYQTTHTPNSGTLELWEVLTWPSEGIWPTPHRYFLLGLLFLLCRYCFEHVKPCDLLLIFRHH